MVTTTQLRRFAFRQGAGRSLLGLRSAVDDDRATTSLVPPAACRGRSGRPLPFGTHQLLDNVHYPSGRVGGEVADVLGHILLAAFGIQRREPSSRYNDHRVIASVRSKFPVHCFVLDEQGLAYLDLYRHALVEVDQSSPAVVPEPGRTTVILAGRYTDYPADYGWLRGALADLEMGINLRSLFVAAELFGVAAALDLDGQRAECAAGLIEATGLGQWTAPLLVSLDTTSASRAMALATSAPPLNEDELRGAEPGLRDAGQIAATMYELRTPPAGPAAGLPAIDRNDRTSWARVLGNRSAGRVAAGLQGFSSVAAHFSRDVLDDHIAAATMPPPHPLLAGVHERIQLSVTVQRVGDLPAGLYRLRSDGLRQLRADETVMQAVEDAFSYPITPDTDSCVRHASLVWLMSVDLPALVTEFGPAAWTLLQMTCGWISHGLSIASAAHDQFARPVRSFDENKIITCFGLQWHETPSFMVISGRSGFAEPVLDLRT